jgi:outer membrane protein OmpA-like peptidoglycan-associated protein/tetratricopeptide (TPR) repeat protein
MKSILQPLFTLALLMYATLSTQAQTTPSEADVLYNRYAYSAAIPLYKATLAKGDNWDAKVRLAECYRKINDAINAEYWYSQVVQSSMVSPEQKLYYAQLLQQNGKYNDAKQWYTEYNKLNPKDSRGNNGIRACEALASFYRDSILYTVQYMPFNSDNSDITPSYYQDGVVFASDRKQLSAFKLYEWTGTPFLSFYFTKHLGTEYTSPSLWLGKANNKYHEAGASYSKTGDEMYFTRNNVNNGKTQRSEDRTVKLKIFHATRNGATWSDATEFAYNGNNFSTGHPSLSADGQTLYFASDRPGGYGGVDIYSCKKDNGVWGVPSNLGPTVNTEGNEMFPSIASDNKLYYASNGLPGLGGLDIFTTITNNGNWATPKNIGSPMNSSKDDFGLVMNEANTEGYFCSNRRGNDDIYSFSKTCLMLTGIVYDVKTNKPIEGATVKITDNGQTKDDKTTDADGKFSICVAADHEYSFTGSKGDYQPNTQTLSTKGITADKAEVKIPLGKDLNFELKGKVYSEATKEPLAGVRVKALNTCTNKYEETTTDNDGKYSFKLQPDCKYILTAIKPNCAENTQEKSTVGLKTSQTLYLDFGMYCKGERIKIDNIYYDVNKSEIRPDAARELDKTLAIFAKYPNMRIELGSHTDCRAPDDYNWKLSQRRATSAVNYLISRGVSPSRLKAAGYGETQPVNRCVDGVNCSDAEHQANRRTEFKILGF